MYVTTICLPRTEDEDIHGPNQEVKVQKAGFRLIIYWLSADTGTV